MSPCSTRPFASKLVFALLSGTIVHFWMQRSAQRLRRQTSARVTSMDVQNVVEGQLSEPLQSGCCFEHSAIYAMLDSPSHPVRVDWLKRVYALGFPLSAGTWLIVHDGAACYVSKVLHILRARSTHIVQEDDTMDEATYFISTRSYRLQADSPFKQGVLAGLFEIERQLLIDNSCGMMFAIGYISFSMLMCTQRSCCVDQNFYQFMLGV